MIDCLPCDFRLIWQFDNVRLVLYVGDTYGRGYYRFERAGHMSRLVPAYSWNLESDLEAQEARDAAGEVVVLW